MAAAAAPARRHCRCKPAASRGCSEAGLQWHRLAVWGGGEESWARAVSKSGAFPELEDNLEKQLALWKRGGAARVKDKIRSSLW